MAYRINTDFTQLTQDESQNLIRGRNENVFNYYTVIYNNEFVFDVGPICERTETLAISKLVQCLDITPAIVLNENLDYQIGVPQRSPSYWNADYRWAPSKDSILTIYNNCSVNRAVIQLEQENKIPLHWGAVLNSRLLGTINSDRTYVFNIPSTRNFFPVEITKPVSISTYCVDEFKIRKQVVQKLIQDGIFRIVQFRNLGITI